MDSKDNQPNSSELLSSAKLVADATRSTLNEGSDKVDKAKVAGAAADLLGAASDYGKLEEKGYGKYVDKAENYLHQYHSSNQSAPTTEPDPETKPADGTGGEKKDSGSVSGYGDYLKMAQGFLGK